jgi:hypothetical protein
MLMLDHIVELLLGLAFALAATFGINVATTSPHGGGVADAAKEAKAASAAPAAKALLGAAGAGATDTALEVLEGVMADAPETASDGLQQAWDSVSSAPLGADAADIAPLDVPAGPPDDVPAGAPEGVPPSDPGRP